MLVTDNTLTLTLTPATMAQTTRSTSCHEEFIPLWKIMKQLYDEEKEALDVKEHQFVTFDQGPYDHWDDYNEEQEEIVDDGATCEDTTAQKTPPNNTNTSQETSGQTQKHEEVMDSMIYKKWDLYA